VQIGTIDFSVNQQNAGVKDKTQYLICVRYNYMKNFQNLPYAPGKYPNVNITKKEIGVNCN